MDASISTTSKSSLSDDFSRALDEQILATEEFLRAHEAGLHEAVESLQAHFQALAESHNPEEIEQLRVRCRMAEEQARAFERRYDELSQRGQKGTKPAAVSGFDWESRKRQMMATLDGGDGGGSDRDDALTLDGAISITDALVSEKDRQINALQLELDGLRLRSSSELARQELLNADELIVAERDRLQTLQNELQDKLRITEINLSVERAKMARQWQELEEQRQAIARNQPIHTDNSNEPAMPKKPNRGRWLTRLGLKERDDDGNGG